MKTELPYASQAALCARCQDLDIGNIGRYSFRSSLDLKATINQLQESKCPLCRLFAAMAPCSREEEKPETNCQLRIHSAKRQLLHIDPGSENFQDLVMLEIRDRQAAVATTQPFLGVLTHSKPRGLGDLGVRFVIRDACDFQFVTECINICQLKHTDTCSQRGLEPVNLQVIDCEARKVVDAARGCRWVALSYVWGPPPYDETLQSPPRVIEDSICLCLLLGYQYLWVDRYCIDQSATEKKMEQILQMDRIYKNAEFTIIAAAGNGPKHGLPGISAIREPQPSLRLDDCILLSTLPAQPFSIQKSKWFSRGWTFQEWGLSRRRLIFTDDQTFFECASMHCPESLVIPPYNTESGSEGHGVAIRSFRTGLGFQRREGDGFSHDISQFCSRELTYPSDTLNAMEGIFQSYRRALSPVYTLMGIPIRTKTAIGTVFTRPCQSFLDGLGWIATVPGNRVAEFPSWTWTGTKGKIETMSVIPREDSRANDVRIWVEDINGIVTMFPEAFDETMAAFHSIVQQCPYLHIEAKILDVDLEDFTDRKIAGYLLRGHYAVFSRPPSEHIVGSVYLDRLFPDPFSQEWKAIVIQGHELNTTPVGEVETKMILVHKVNGIYERFGVVVQMSLLHDNAWGAEPRRILQEWWQRVRKAAPTGKIRVA